MREADAQTLKASCLTEPRRNSAGRGLLTGQKKRLSVGLRAGLSLQAIGYDWPQMVRWPKLSRKLGTGLSDGSQSATIRGQQLFSEEAVHTASAFLLSVAVG